MPLWWQFFKYIWDMLKPVSERFYSVYPATEVQEEVIEVVLQRFFGFRTSEIILFIAKKYVWKSPTLSHMMALLALSALTIHLNLSFKKNHYLILNICPSFLVLTPDFLGCNSRNFFLSKICQSLHSTKWNL